MAEIFKRTKMDFGGAFAADTGLLMLAGGLSPVLVQNLTTQYSQQVTRLYELGALGARSKVYYVGGRSQGNMTLARVIGPAVQLAAFYDRYGDVCMAANNTIGIGVASSCGLAADEGTGLFGSTAMFLQFCVLTQVGIAVQAQDLVISENNGVMFSNVDYLGT